MDPRERLLALRLRQRPSGPADVPLERRPAAEAIPLSFSQEGLWFLDQLSGPGTAYNVIRALRLRGRLDASLLEGSLRALVQRHESLRTAIETRDGAATQIVRPARESAARLRFEALSLDGWTEAEVEDALRGALSAAAAEPFDLSCAPLLRVKLVRIRDDDHVLILVVHHIVCDGWSVGILLRDLSTLYARKAQPGALLPLPVQFADYAAWQRRRLTPEALNTQIRYWRQQLEGVATLELPTDRPRPARPSRCAASEHFLLPEELVESLHALARRRNATLFMVLLAAFQVLLMRQSRQDDISVGVPVANRSRVELEDLVGYFVNTLVMRSSLAGNPRFDELLERVRETVLDAFAHQEVPFERLVAELRPERDPGRNPLYQVSFSLQSQPPAALTIDGVTAEEIVLPGTEAKFDLLLTLTEAEGALRGQIVYAAELFEVGTMRSFASRYRTLLTGIAANATMGVRLLPLLDDGDRERLLRAWNATAQAYDARASAHALIERQAGLTPDAVALVHNEERLTYRALDAKANRLARHLRSRGVGRGMLVGLATERGIDMVVSQLAILKAGAGYLPLDTSYPAQRLAFMIEDARLALLITESHQLGTLAQPREHCVLLDLDGSAIAAQSETRLPTDDVLDSRPEDPAYVIYTSGSTGRPKGVALPHRAVANLFASLTKAPGLSASDRVLAITTVSFDIAMVELLVPLSVGAEIIIASRDQARDGQALRELLEHCGANFMQATPLTWRMLVDAGWRGAAQFRAITGGEALSQVLATSLLERVSELWNGYGPTETTVYSTFWRVEHPERGISIGRPIANTVVRVLDEHGQLCPPGVSGEIYIGGDGLALGYLEQPELTAQRFVADAYGETADARLYRTGDQGRWRHDGLLEHQGRLDFQVKIRGYRIELGEVEAHLSAHPQVAQSAVVAREDAMGDPCLVAYVVAAESAASERELRNYLRARLPDFMVPQHFVALDALPRLPNGKTDRKALPVPKFMVAEPLQVASSSALEETIARIWCEVLNLRRVGNDDNFFELGGHSIVAARAIARLREATGSDIPLRVLFESPTVAGLAARLEKKLQTPGDVRTPCAAARQGGTFPASLAQASLWFLNEVSQGRAVYNIPRAVSLSGLLDLGALTRSVQALVERHASLRTGFELRDGVPVQVVHAPDGLPAITAIEPVLGAGMATDRARLVEETLQTLAGEPFDLSRPPLMRVCVLQLDDREHMLLLVVHHIVSDGWSINILMHELSVLYRAFSAGEPNPLRPLPMQFFDCVVRTAGEVDTKRDDENLAYWRRQLAYLKPLALPTDRAYPAERSYRGATHAVHLAPALVARLESMARRQGATLYMMLLAAFHLLLMRYSGEEDIAVGCPIAGRERPELDGIVGYFVNTLVLRVNMAGNPTFTQLLERVRDVCLDAFSHQALPFDRLVAELKPPRDLRRNPLYQASFALQNAPDAGQDFGSLRCRRVPVHSGTAKFELFLSLTQEQSGLIGTLEYNTDVFDATTTGRMVAELVRLLERVAVEPEQAIERLCGGGDGRRVFPGDHPGSAREEVPKSLTPSALHRDASAPVEHAAVRREPRWDSGDAAAPEGVEQSLRSIWREVLQVEEIGLDENFFELGGHSLLAIRLVDTVNRQLGSHLRVASLFQGPTIRGQASLLRHQEATGTCVVAIQPRGERPPLFVVPGYGGAVAPFHALTKAFGEEQPLFVVDLDSLCCDTAHSSTLESVAATVLESMRRVQPHGPYHIAGYSLGGRIAYEIAQQLHADGEDIGLLAMLDCSAPGYPRVQSFIARALLHVKHATRLTPRESGTYVMARVRSLKKYLKPVRVYPQVFRDDMAERRTQAAQAIQARAQMLYDASLAYVARAYPGTLTIVRAAVRNPRLGMVDNDPLLGWQRLVGNRIHLAHMNCTHQQMLEPEHAPALAELLAGWLGRESVMPGRTSREAWNLGVRCGSGRSNS